MKTAIITGTSYGIGHAIAKKLLTLGYKVYGISRSNTDIMDPNFTWIEADLSRDNVFKEIADTISENKVDLLINNAGISYKLDTLKTNQEDFDKIFKLNYWAYVKLTNILFDKLKGGNVINITSDLSKLPWYGYAIYSSSKGAVSQYFKVFAFEFPDIKVVTLMPGMVDTPLLRKIYGDTFEDYDKILKPEDLANNVEYILKNASEFKSGDEIFVNNDFTKSDYDVFKTPMRLFNATSNKLEEIV